MLNHEKNKLLTEIGPGTPMGTMMRRHWIPAVLSSELQGPDSGPVRIRLLGENLIAFRDSKDRVGILDALCPHRRAPLYFGLNENGGLTCVYHAWKFDVNGNCMQLPHLANDPEKMSRIKTKSYPCKEVGGIVWTYMGPGGEMPEMPCFDWVDLPDDQTFMTKQLVDCNYSQAIEGDMDPFHVSILHMTTDDQRRYQSMEGDEQDYVGEPEDGVLSLEHEFRLIAADPVPEITVYRTPFGVFSGARRVADADKSYWRMNQFILPFYAGTPWTENYAAQCNVWVPRDDVSTVVWRIHYDPGQPLREDVVERLGSGWDAHIPASEYAEPTSEPQSEWYPKRNRSNDYGYDRKSQKEGPNSVAGIAGIWAQDRIMTEGMGPVIDRTEESLMPGDAPIIEVRKCLLNAAGASDKSADVPIEGVRYPTQACVQTAVHPNELDFAQVSEAVLAKISA